MARFIPAAATLAVAVVLLTLGAMTDALGMQPNLPDRYEVWCAADTEATSHAASTVLGI